VPVSICFEALGELLELMGRLQPGPATFPLHSGSASVEGDRVERSCRRKNHPNVDSN